MDDMKKLIGNESDPLSILTTVMSSDVIKDIAKEYKDSNMDPKQLSQVVVSVFNSIISELPNTPETENIRSMFGMLSGVFQNGDTPDPTMLMGILGSMGNLNKM